MLRADAVDAYKEYEWMKDSAALFSYFSEMVDKHKIPANRLSFDEKEKLRIGAIISPWFRRYLDHSLFENKDTVANAFLDSSPLAQKKFVTTASGTEQVQITTLKALQLELDNPGKAIDLLETLLIELSVIDGNLVSAASQRASLDKRKLAAKKPDSENPDKTEKALSAVDIKSLTKGLEKSEEQFKDLLKNEISSVQLDGTRHEKSNASYLTILVEALNCLIAVVALAKSIADCIQSSNRLNNYNTWLEHELVNHSTLTNELKKLESMDKISQFKQLRDRRNKAKLTLKADNILRQLEAEQETYPSADNLERYNGFLFPEESDHKRLRSVDDLITILAEKIDENKISDEKFNELLKKESLSLLERELFRDELKSVQSLPLEEYRERLAEEIKKYIADDENADISALTQTQLVRLIISLEKNHVESLIEKMQQQIIARHKLYIHKTKALSERSKQDKLKYHSKLEKIKHLIDKYVSRKNQVELKSGETPFFEELMTPYQDGWKLSPDEQLACDKIKREMVKDLQDKYDENIRTLKARSLILIGVSLGMMALLLPVIFIVTAPILVGIIGLAILSAVFIFGGEWLRNGVSKDVKNCISTIYNEIQDKRAYNQNRQQAKVDARISTINYKENKNVTVFGAARAPSNDTLMQEENDERQVIVLG